MAGGADMTGRTCMITGATNGIGQAAALALARLGAGLVLVGRNRERGERAVEEIRRESGNDDISLLLADLSSQAEIRQLAKDFLATDVVIAGSVVIGPRLPHRMATCGPKNLYAEQTR